MAKRNNQIAIPEGPDWTDVFHAAAAGGADEGIGMRGVIISCADDSANSLEYRIDDPADPSGEGALLLPGQVFPAWGHQTHIRRIQMRGVGGAAVGGVEQTVF